MLHRRSWLLVSNVQSTEQVRRLQKPHSEESPCYKTGAGLVFVRPHFPNSKITRWRASPPKHRIVSWPRLRTPWTRPNRAAGVIPNRLTHIAMNMRVTVTA